LTEIRVIESGSGDGRVAVAVWQCGSDSGWVAVGRVAVWQWQCGSGRVAVVMTVAVWQ
jgi:hypothetical protein